MVTEQRLTHVFQPNTRAVPIPPRMNRDEVFSSQRGRLLEAVAFAVVEKGYNDVTIGDIVDRARASRTTFYRHFAGKEPCFVAAFDASVAFLFNRIASAQPAGAGWDDLLRAQIGAYVGTLVEEPVLARAFIVDVMSAGDAVRRRRNDVQREFVAYVRGICELAMQQDPTLTMPSDFLLATLVGGIDDVIAGQIIENGPAVLPAFTADIIAAITLVIRSS